MWHFKGLGWFSRFVSPDLEDLGRFYMETMGIPRIRQGQMQKVDFLWAGEVIVHQLLYERIGDTVDTTEGDVDRAPLVPVYRVTRLDALLADLVGRGASVTEVREGAFGREAHVVDPSGSLVGLREVPRHSQLLHDQVAKFRRERGEAFNPGCAKLPQHFQELGWIVRRVADLGAMEAFYREVLHLPMIGRHYGRALFDLGDNTVLELAEGGVARTAPVDRRETAATIILRVDDIAAFCAGAAASEMQVVHEKIEWPRGALTYVADPEGNLVGVEERFHPAVYCDRFAAFAEDLEAQRRWIEHQAAGSQTADARSRVREA
jgi:predicted enzyme related to lactoylglutathione lyase